MCPDGCNTSDNSGWKCRSLYRDTLGAIQISRKSH